MLTKAAINSEHKTAVKSSEYSWMRLAASACLAAGAVLLVTSLIISVMSLVDDTSHGTAGTLVLVTAFGFFGLGAHFLDCHDARQARKREY